MERNGGENGNKTTDPRRTFVSKVRQFIDHYPGYSTSTDKPCLIIRQSIEELKRLVMGNNKNISDLEPLDSEMTNGYLCPEELFQFELIGEPKRYIIYRPNKLLGEDTEEDITLYDLVYMDRKQD